MTYEHAIKVALLRRRDCHKAMIESGDEAIQFRKQRQERLHELETVLELADRILDDEKHQVISVLPSVTIAPGATNFYAVLDEPITVNIKIILDVERKS